MSADPATGSSRGTGGRRPPAPLRPRLVAAGSALAVTAAVAVGLTAAAAVEPAAVEGTGAGLAVAVPPTAARFACPGPPTSYVTTADDAASTGDGAGADDAGTAVATSLRVLTLPAGQDGAGQDGAGQDGAGQDGAGQDGAVVGSLALTALVDDAPADDAPADDAPAVVTGVPLTAGGGVVARDAGAAARAGVAEPVAGAQPLVGGAATALATRGDLRGLAASPCVPATDEAWLVGGSTLVGDSTRLVLANPGTATATVRASVLSAQDGRPPRPVPDLALAPGEQRSVLLEGVVPGAASVAVRVASEGGAVSAWLVTTSLRGLVPQGVDVVVPGEGPRQRQVVPGVVVQRGDATPVLRLVAPSGPPVVASWELSGPDGAVVPEDSPLAVTVPGGSVADVPLAGLGSGGHTVVVTGDGPLTAAVGQRSSDEPERAGDHAWTGAAPALTGAVLVALPDGERDGDGIDTDTELVLQAPLPAAGAAPAAVSVSVLDAAGQLGAVPSAVALDGGRTVALDTDDLAEDSGAREEPVALLVTAPPGAGVTAALRTGASADGGGRLQSGHAVVPPPPGAGELLVRLRGTP